MEFSVTPNSKPKCWENIFEGSLNLTIETGCRCVHYKAVDRATYTFSPTRELDSKIRQVNFAIFPHFS